VVVVGVGVDRKHHLCVDDVEEVEWGLVVVDVV
jgi:hypothetical protein